MAVKNSISENEHDERIVLKAKQLWNSNQKLISIAVVAIAIIIGGYWSYNNFIQKPKEAKAADALFKAEEYYRVDSLQKALHGDGLNIGLIKVLDKFSGTKAANLAHFYAGDCYLRTGDFANAIKQLEAFDTDAAQVQARAYKLLADAYSELNKNDEAISYYQKAAHHFTDDTYNAAEYLFNAAGLSEKTGKTKEAIELYKEVKDKFPGTQQSSEADKYLAKLGVYN